ncbi:MAG: hypothetical protein Q8K60_05775, partial [Parachlamydiaceae bacterium]|nr:hypothetical protein [Parachlamydiaceae bacterium]
MEKKSNTISSIRKITQKDSVLCVLTYTDLSRSLDLGNSWEKSLAVNDNTGYSNVLVFDNKLVVTNFDEINLSADFGKTWDKIKIGLSRQATREITSYDSNSWIIFVSTSDSEHFITTDGGSNWSVKSINTNNMDSYVPSNITFFDLYFKSYIKTSHGWKEIFGPTKGPWFDKYGTHYDWRTYQLLSYDTLMFAATSKGVSRTGRSNPKLFYTQSDYNNDWEYVLTNVISYCLGRLDMTIFAGTSNGVYYSDNLGGIWKSSGLQGEEVQKLITFDNKVIAFTKSGFFKSIDRGIAWNRFDIGLGKIVQISESNDYLIAKTYQSDNKYHLWKRSLYQIMTDIKTESTITTEFGLSQNYPNPFNPETTISYSIPKSEHVTLKVYDLLGREVATLVEEFKQAGTYNSIFSIINYKLS